MGLPSAIKAHAVHDLKNAQIQYERALSQKTYSQVLFQNYGALLREIGDLDRSKQIYEQGLRLYPASNSIRKNYINLLVDSSPEKALPLLFETFYSILAENNDEFDESHGVAIVECLRKLGHFAWAYHVLFWLISVFGLTSRLAVQCVNFLCDNSYYSRLLLDHKLDIENVLIRSIADAKPLQKAELYYALCWFKLKQSADVAQSLHYLSKARDIFHTKGLSDDERRQCVKLNDINSWNASVLLLQNEQFSLGWKLYDYGLRSPAKGPQAWQRALPKPFTNAELSLWKGTSLRDKSILLLEEQAIGDAMQFATLVPALSCESKHLGLLVSKRLYPIYQRSFKQYIDQGTISVYTLEDVNRGTLCSANFDFQSPLGSICQYRFTHPKLYASHSPIITSDYESTQLLKDKYLVSHQKKPKRIVGLSWRGGGTSERMNQKSIPIPELAKALSSFEDVLFVSLQYGDCAADVAKFRQHGVHVLLDSDIDAVNEFDRWLSQVAVCDSVISVANTTIHASGGLNIPTLCLLSKYIDWRWLKNHRIDQSYWYPSVGIARQGEDGSWKHAISRLSAWIMSGTPRDWSTPYTVAD